MLWLTLAACGSPSTTPDAAVALCPDGTKVPDGGVCVAPEPTCDAGGALTVDGGCAPVGWTQCPVGFALDPSGWDCAPVTNTAGCDAGAAPQLGTSECGAVGWTQCPAGFAPDPSGWSCDPVLPAAVCSGATREALGTATCVPVGDCAAAFPPAGATLFVDDSFTAGQLDATHFAKISDALSAAPAGATIAVEAGSYTEALAPARAAKLVGRCAGQVTLRAPVGKAALTVIGARGVELQGFTVRDALLAVRIELGGQLAARQVVFEANLRSGLQLLDAASELTLEGSVVRGTLADPATASFGQGMAVSYGATVTINDSAFVANRENGIFLDRASKATLTRVVIQGTLPRASTGKLGWGIGAQGAAQLELVRSVVRGNAATGLAVVQAGTKATVRDSIVSDTGPGLDNNALQIGFNVVVLTGAALDWTGGAISRGAQGQLLVRASTASLRGVTMRGVLGGVPILRAIGADRAATLTIDHTAILDSAGAGLDAFDDGTAVVLDHVLIDGVQPEPNVPQSGTGLRAQEKARVAGSQVVLRRASAAGAIATSGGTLALSDCVVSESHDVVALDGGEAGHGVVAQTGGSATVLRSLLEKNTVAGIYAHGAGSRLTMGQSVIRGTRLSSQGEFGQGAICEDGATIELTEVAVLANHSAGVQVSEPGSQLKLLRATVRGTLPNATGTRGRGANADYSSLLAATDSVFVDNQQVGIFALFSRVELTRTSILSTRADPDGKYGNALEVLTDSVLMMSGGALQSNAGIGAVFAEGAGVLDSVRIGKNVVGLHAQDGSAVEELATAPMTLTSRQVVVTSGTAFVGNQNKFGGGSVPIPPR